MFRVGVVCPQRRGALWCRRAGSPVKTIVPIKVSAVVIGDAEQGRAPSHPQGVHRRRARQDRHPARLRPAAAAVRDDSDVQGHGVYNGAKCPTCSCLSDGAQAGRRVPRALIMAMPFATADADGVTTHPKATINNGARYIYFYVVAVLGPRHGVQQPIAADDHQARPPGRWQYRLDFEMSAQPGRSSPASRCAAEGLHATFGSRELDRAAPTARRTHNAAPARRGALQPGKAAPARSAPSRAEDRLRRCSAQCTPGSSPPHRGSSSPRRCSSPRRPWRPRQLDRPTAAPSGCPARASERVEAEASVRGSDR